jgi:hypothetical protein
MESFLRSREARTAEMRREKLANEERARAAAEDARRAAEFNRLQRRLAQVQALRGVLESARPRASAMRSDAETLSAQCEALRSQVATASATVDKGFTACYALDEALAQAAPLSVLTALDSAAVQLIDAASENSDALVGASSEALGGARSLHAELESLLWPADDEASTELCLAQLADQYATWGTLRQLVSKLISDLIDLHEVARSLSQRSVLLAPSFAESTQRVAQLAIEQGEEEDGEPRPPGTRTIALSPLSPTQEGQVDGALAQGDPSEQLAEFENIPVTRKDMRTVRLHQWLNDEVINLFMKLLAARERTKATNIGDGDDGLPSCYFAQTNFYTKLAYGSTGYSYKDVRRWTKREKVDVFSKDLLIVPIHVHGNHWTLAVINRKLKRFEYYDSMRGSEGSVLINLRRWLEDEHQDKNPPRAGG